ncbi:hypothetical protein ACM1RC_10375 [Paenibacillus azoreducens]|uniref:hypothetical protein n=1 Tax=Paenibacillus azoreducens TaxID=116718 RepID=UPI0039F5E2E6
MTKQIQAYFKTEDDAEKAKAHLIGENIEHLEVGRMSAAPSGRRRILLPLVPAGMAANPNPSGASGMAWAPGAAGIPAVPVVEEGSGLHLQHEGIPPEYSGEEHEEIEDVPEWADLDADDYRNLEYILSCKVKDKDHADIVDTLRNHGGYVEIFD